jgi:hypothetical protein
MRTQPGCRQHLKDGSNATVVTARSHVVCMSVPGGVSTELTAELERPEAQGALRTLHQLFANAHAAAEGWTAETVANGLRISKGGCTATFRVAATGAVDAPRRLHPISAD